MVLETGPATLADLRPNLGRPRSLLGQAIQSFLLAYQVEGKTPKTLDRLRRTLEDFKKLDPIRPPKVPRKVVQVFTREHIERLLSLCPPVNLLIARNRAILLMLLGTGLRRFELARLELEDVDLAHECVKVMGKGQKERRVYLARAIIRALLGYIAFRKDNKPCLWVSEEGRPLESNGIRLAVYRLQKRAGIQGVRISSHTFRHTFAVNALRAGISLRHLQAIGG